MSAGVEGGGPWTVGRIALAAPSVESSDHCGVVLERLLARPELPSLPIMEDGRLAGIGGRERLLRHFANPLHQALFQKRPIRLLMSAAPLIVAAEADVDFVTQEIATRNREALEEGFLITDGERLSGVGSAHSLLELAAAKARHRIKEIDEARNNAERASEAKSTFLAGMSHELRTPLNAIIGFSEMLRLGITGPLSERQQDCVGDIHRSAILLLDLINDVLDLSSIEANKIVLREESVEVAALAAECIRSLGPRSSAKRQSLRYDCAGPPLRLRADRRRTHQILLNLVTNAVKYTPDGGRIWIEADIDAEGRPGFAVRDDGIGIPADKIEHVLSPFGRAASAYTAEVEGTGIGLALARRLSEHHGGTLTLESELGRGTCVSVRFPRERLMAPGALRETG